MDNQYNLYIRPRVIEVVDDDIDDYIVILESSIVLRLSTLRLITPALS
jgi:hypothetical protein